LNNRDFLSNLTDLVVLDLNVFRFKLGKMMGDLQNLRVLRITVENDCDLERIGNLTNLEVLRFHDFDSNIKLLKEGTFKNLKHLKSLNMVGFKFLRIEENAFYGLDQLVELIMKIGCNEYPNAGLEMFQWFNKLEKT
jgi:hypothetical protein